MKLLHNLPKKTWLTAFAAFCIPVPIAGPAHAAAPSTPPPSRPGISEPAGDEVGRLRREVEALRTQAAELRAAVDALREEVAQLHAQMNREPSRLGGSTPSGRISSVV